MKKLAFLLLPLALAACGDDDEDNGLQYASVEDEAALLRSANRAIEELRELYGNDVDEAVAQITLEQTDQAGFDPDGAAPRQGGRYRLRIERFDCAGNGPTAHAIAHIVRLVARGDADAAHTDRALFAGACGGEEACVNATVEASTRSLCTDDGGPRDGTGDDVGDPGGPSGRP